MSTIAKAINSSVGRKLVMSLTGLFLISFLLVHLSGNLQLFKSDGGLQFNAYAKFMVTNPIIRIMEIGLLLGFVLHIYQAIVLTRANNKAKGKENSKADAASSTWYSRNMGLTGTVILVFLIIHLKNFYFQYKFGEVGIDAGGNKDLYTIVATMFAEEWWYSILYIISMVILGFHLNHGFQSAFRSFGLRNSKYSPIVNSVGTLYAIVVPAGYIAMPLYFWLFV
ncbi:MAG: succinate dehydrogenase / fumarate reductase cytochrome b subunit [Sphingobacteriales bacterium]|jgi:succinate dehydrogenase / fumarate reductase cytochrome b subunit